MSGPRAYRTGTEKALFHLSRGLCYFPHCAEPVIKFVEGVPVVNVHISHIRGANPGSPRYDPDMTDEERASFDNLILLCKPHHDFVDRIQPAKYSVELLTEWKMSRERGELEALRGLQNFTEEKLADMLESFVSKLAPHREVTLEVSGGVLLPEGAATIPLEGWREILKLNPGLRTSDALVVVTVRNTGQLVAHVDAVNIIYKLTWGEVTTEFFSLMGRNDYPSFNPTLSKRLDVGESMHWFSRLETFAWVKQRAEETDARFRVLQFFGQVRLGSGETVVSDVCNICDLPLYM